MALTVNIGYHLELDILYRKLQNNENALNKTDKRNLNNVLSFLPIRRNTTKFEGIKVDTISNVWQWHLNPIWGYSARGVNKMLTSNEHAYVSPSMDLIWHKQIPLKVLVFA